MFRSMCVGLGFAIAASSALGAPLEGRIIKLKAGQQFSVNVPLSLSADGVEDGTRVKVVEPKTGKSFPSTVRGGELVFISEGAMPGTEHEYIVDPQGDAQVPFIVNLTPVEGKKAIDVRIADEHFTTYHYSEEWKKPFLWPVNTEYGVGITRDFPMGEKEITGDHPHHKSMWVAYGALNGVDCWAEGENSGFQETVSVEHGSGDAYGWIRAKNVWTDKDHKPVISEEREYRFYASPANARLFDLTVTFTADHGDVLWKDTKEGGIFAFRIRDSINGEHAGVMTLSDGQQKQENTWGKPAPWLDYSGEIADKGWAGISVFDNAANLRFPTRWHCRDYGLVGANMFGLNDFTAGKENGDFTLKSGETITFKYRCLIHSGDVKQGAVADRYADYATPPSAAWAESN
ncbi:MAG: hypothetical protein AMXMBFR84_28610 [Candidatus Hydrogenedentota bacterium]